MFWCRCSKHEFHNNLLMGIAVRSREGNPSDRSGYQPLRLATELFPALVAIIGPHYLSPFWSVTFYFSLVAFGIGQQVNFIGFRPSSMTQSRRKWIHRNLILVISAALPVGDLAVRHQWHRGLPRLLPQIVGDDHHLLHMPLRFRHQLTTSYWGTSSVFTFSSIKVPYYNLGPRSFNRYVFFGRTADFYYAVIAFRIIKMIIKDSSLLFKFLRDYFEIFLKHVICLKNESNL